MQIPSGVTCNMTKTTLTLLNLKAYEQIQINIPTLKVVNDVEVIKLKRFSHLGKKLFLAET